ncbi:MAG: hypothetical protein GX088_03485 [Clostridia bacterium]|nr:hypothetical protein [Clostridia bacterium]
MLRKIIGQLKKKSRNANKLPTGNLGKVKIRDSLEENIKIFRQILGESNDVIIRRVKIGGI